MIWILAANIFMASLCAIMCARKARRAKTGAWYCLGIYGIALLGGWLIVPEIWDTSWMDKYIQEEANVSTD